MVTATEFKIGMSKWLLKLQMSRAMGLKSTAAEVWEVRRVSNDLHIPLRVPTHMEERTL